MNNQTATTIRTVNLAQLQAYALYATDELTEQQARILLSELKRREKTSFFVNSSTKRAIAKLEAKISK